MPARFVILRPLEEDSASTLFQVRDEKRGVEACLRRFKTKNAQEIEGLTELFNQLAGIDSIHVEKTVDFGTDKDGFYVVTAAPAASETLEAVLERGPLTAEEFEVVALQLLEALDALHDQAIVHGSIRADYVRITGKSATEWRVTLQGFGQGFATKDDSKEAQIRAYRCTAPEQWVDGTTRRRTDVYALGCVLYEALAARPPFDGRALKEIRHKHIGHDLAPLQKLAHHVPSWMCAWVMHLMAADPE
ncbi:MAG: protein kinase, partial [Verrucomicrobiaceae bacterium]|nr:protein kinase [Verrucomicrobiaceae bacterium]